MYRPTPHKINFALSDVERSLITSIRRTTWLPLDEVWEMLLEQNTSITRSSVYRTFCRNDINKVPQEKRDKATCTAKRVRSSKNTNLDICTLT